jgi:hypothetical protein
MTDILLLEILVNVSFEGGIKDLAFIVEGYFGHKIEDGFFG